jgi:anti-anti-sigma regulatory factor
LTRARTAGGDVVLLGISESTRQLLVLTKLNKTFSVFNEMEEALAHFQNAQV